MTTLAVLCLDDRKAAALLKVKDHMESKINLASHVGLNLTGKTALVCGASRGIGAATARALATQGARILALARSQEELAKVVKDLPGEGHQAFALDLGDRTRLEQAILSALKHSPIEILINNSSGPKGGPIASADETEFTTAFAQHVLVNQLLCKLLLPGMKESGYGRIINIISTSVKTPLPNLGVSNTIRAAVAAWGKTLSQEVASYGVTVNSVLPGFTKTDRLASLLKAASEKRNLPEETIASEWRASVPAGRFGEPEEIAAAVAFLASPAASYINGIALAVDGGRTGSL
jgi:3-oxoacyl-[acyl-carrier protein] reductase